MFILNLIDANGDGVDDNTGATTNQGYDPYTGTNSQPSNVIGRAPNRSDYSDDIAGTCQYIADTFVYYVTFPFLLIGSVFTSIFSTISNSFVWVADFTGFLGSLFSFLPQPILGLLELGVGVMVVGLVYKVIRR
jgi:hypothetical protein